MRPCSPPIPYHPQHRIITTTTNLISIGQLYTTNVMPTVSDTPNPLANEFSQTLCDAYTGEPTVTDPVALFATACINSISSGEAILPGDATSHAVDDGIASIASIATGKRRISSRVATYPSPRRKRRSKPSSPKKLLSL